MYLANAILRSNYNVALLRERRPVGQRIYPEITMAVLTQNGVILILSCRTQTVRLTNQADVSRNDWDPFAPKSTKTRHFVKPDQVIEKGPIIDLVVGKLPPFWIQNKNGRKKLGCIECKEYEFPRKRVYPDTEDTNKWYCWKCGRKFKKKQVAAAIDEATLRELEKTLQE